MNETTFDKVISQENKDLILKVIKIRKDLGNLIDIEDFINISKEIINKSNIFSFSSEVAEKFINKKQPVFKLKINEESDLYKKIDFKKISEELNNTNDEKKIISNKSNKIISEYVVSEIIRSISDYIDDIIDSNETIKKIIEDVDRETGMDNRYFLTNIYSIRIANGNNLIFLSYFN